MSDIETCAQSSETVARIFLQVCPDGFTVVVAHLLTSSEIGKRPEITEGDKLVASISRPPFSTEDKDARKAFELLAQITELSMGAEGGLNLFRQALEGIVAQAFVAGADFQSKEIFPDTTAIV